MLKAPFWQQAPFFRLLVPLAAGIAFAANSLLSLYTSFAGAMAAILTLVAMQFFLKTESSSRKWLIFACINLGFFCTGAWLYLLNRVSYKGSTSSQDGCMAVVTQVGKANQNYTRIIVHVVDPQTNGLALLYVAGSNESLSLKEADTVAIPAHWQPVKNAGNPGEFNFAAWASRNHIVAQQYCSARQLQLAGAANPSARGWVRSIHNIAMDKLSAAIADTVARGLVQSMLLGDERELDAAVKDNFSKTGIAHILVISGGNILALAEVILLALAWIKHKKYHRYKLLLALPFILIYVIVTGISPSAVRAGIMFLFFVINVFFNSNRNPVNNLCASAFFTLCIWPEWLFSVGFQLSYLAVISLTIYYKPFLAGLKDAGRKLAARILTKKLKDSKMVSALFGWLGAVTAATLAASVLVVPLVAYYFHSFAPLFIFSNLAAAIFTVFVLVGGLLIFCLSPVPHLAFKAGQFVSKVVHIFYSMNLQLELPAYSSIPFAISTLQLILFFAILLAATIWVLGKLKPMVFVALSATFILLADSCLQEWRSLRQRQFVVYNASAACLGELMNGRRCVNDGDTAWLMPGNKAIARNAHLYLGINQTSGQRLPEVFRVGKSTIVWLTHQLNGTGDFPADVVIDASGSNSISEINRVFHPSMVVLGNNVNKRAIRHYLKEARALGIKVHHTRTNGAWQIKEDS